MRGSVIPQSYGLLPPWFPVIRLLKVGPISSLSKIPPALLVTMLLATVEWSTPMRWIPSPQSKPSAVSKSGMPGHVAVLGFRLLLLTTALLKTLTNEALATRIPSKLAFADVNPCTTTLLTPGLWMGR